MPEWQTDIQVIEKLESDVLGTTQELQTLKWSIEGLNDEERAQIISENSKMLEDIGQIIDAYKAEYDRLEQENRTENTEKLNQLKDYLVQLDNIYIELKDQISAQTNAALSALSDEAVANQNQSEQNQENPGESEPEKKWIRGWWRWLTDWQRRWIRIAWWVWAWIWIFSLFRRRRRKKLETTTAVTTPTNWLSRSEARRQRIAARRAKPFWDRPLWKAIKWTWIWWWIYYVVHWVSTGKWSLKDVFNWRKDAPVNSANHVYDNYIELMEDDPEKYREYEEIWTNINNMYDSIWDTERNYFWDDSQIVMWEIWNRVEEGRLKKAEGYEHVDAKWLVPYSLDNFYGNVGDMLSHKWFNKYIKAKDIEGYKQKIIEFGAEWFNKIMVPFLSSFASFATFWIVSSDSAQEKMDKYLQHLNDHAEERQAELDLFFRQYMKVLTYMADKKNALALKEARKIISAKWEYDGDARPSDEDDQKDMLLEAINDKDWVEKNLKWTKYGTFMSSNILWACRILEDEELDDSEPTEELQEVIDDADEQTEKIIWWSFDNNAFTVAEEKLSNWQTLGSSEITWLQKVADNVVEDLWDTTETSWMYDTFDYAFEALWLDEQAKQTMLAASGLDKCFTTMVWEIKELRTKVITNPTKENVEELKNLVWEYTSMKKELAVAMYWMKEAEENKDYLDYVKQYGWALCTFFGHFWNSLKKVFKLEAWVWDIFNVFAWLTVSGGMLCLVWNATQKPLVRRVWRQAMNTWLLPVTLARLGLWRTGWWPAVASRINVIWSVDVGRAQNLLERGILDGTLNPRQVKRIVKKNPWMKYGALNAEASPETVYDAVVKKMFWDRLTDDEITLFRKYNRKVKNLVHYDKSGIVNWWLRGWYTNLEVVGKNTVFKELKEFDDIMKNMPKGPQKRYMQSLLKKCGTAGKLEEDLKFLNALWKNEAFLKKLSTEDLKYLKKLKLSELRVLDEAGDLDRFVRWEKHLWELLNWVPRLNRQAEKVTRRMFNERITSEISKIEKTYWKNMWVIQKNTIARLNSLKKASHTDDEIKAFMTMMDNGFEPKYFSQIEKMFKLEYQSGKQIWKELKTLLMAWEYDEFATLLKQENKANAAVFRKAGIIVDEASEVSILKHLNKIFKVESKAGRVEKPIIKAFVKIVAKVL